jgi:hypothetical protein
VIARNAAIVPSVVNVPTGRHQPLVKKANKARAAEAAAVATVLRAIARSRTLAHPQPSRRSTH